MARIPMTNGFRVLPEGEYIFRIYDVTYDENFGKLVVKMISAKGDSFTERFSLKNQNDEWNEGALNAFSFFAKTVLDNFDRADIDPKELIGGYLSGEITHTEVPSRTNPSKTMTFAHLGDYAHVDGFDETPCEKTVKLFPDLSSSENLSAPAKAGLNLDSLLN